jgi:S1-C subfamily serine protease
MKVWISKKGLVGAFLPILALIAAACSSGLSGSTNEGATPTLTSLDSPPAAAVSAPVVNPPQINAPTPVAPAASPALAQDLDADAIVAAQEEVLGRIYTEELPSVVHIRVYQSVSSFRFGGVPSQVPQGEGSGFVWDGSGHVVTNYHVVADADRVTVIFHDGSQADAKVLGTDPDADIAVLKVNTSRNLRPVKLGDSDAVKVGQLVAAIGNPFGQEFTMTSGIVSAVGRTIQSGTGPYSVPEVIQTDAAINPGNSGGPLLDRKGQVIGINTQIISRSGSNAGIGFAVPINTAKRVVPVLISGGSYSYSWLGVTGGTLTPETAEARGLPAGTQGVAVGELTRGGPAASAGLRANSDVIVAINGTPVNDMDDLISYLANNTRPGDRVTLDVLREGGRRVKVEVTLGTRPRAG